MESRLLRILWGRGVSGCRVLVAEGGEEGLPAPTQSPPEPRVESPVSFEPGSSSARSEQRLCI